MDYTKRLYDLRIDNDLRQEDVARILKVTSQAYGMYENGKRSLPIVGLSMMCYKIRKLRRS
ncbi:MAG: helix-turn-helix transcriptional regulator [Clostridia bacterium]|nr:helix-turn-helix transcriptional regulator [Clostridia bacterium]